MFSNLHLSNTLQTQDIHPTDTVSSLHWITSKSGYNFGAVSWDSTFRVYQFEPISRTIQQKVKLTTPDPCLSITTAGEETWLAGSVTGSILVVHPNIYQREVLTFDQHGDAIKDIYHYPSAGYFLSIGCDKTIKVWDIRVEGMIGSITFPENIYCSDFDLTQQRIALGFSDEKVYISSLTDLLVMFGREITQLVDSPLGKGSQLSAISLSKVDPMIAFATSDGRANVSKIVPRTEGSNISSVVTFKAHKLDPGEEGNNSQLKILYPVHAIEFHPTLSHTLLTAGGDGKIHFWDSLRRDRIRTLDFGTIPVTKATFSPDGKYIAHARGYDWAKGVQGDMSYSTSIGVYEVQPQDVNSS